MHAHCFQHVAFEGMGAIEQWLHRENFTISYTRFFENKELPDIETIDWLIIMGGPMSINDEQDYPWLVQEKKFIRDCIAKQKTVVGICLGSQLIAGAMGCRIYKNNIKEIGWFPVTRQTNNEFTREIGFPDVITVFHWHGETFDLPQDAVLIASSENCKNQIFTVGRNVIGFQCHLETTEESLNALANNCADELKPAPFIQSAKEMIQQYPKHADSMHQLLFKMLNYQLNGKI
ncbi:MAG TPA: type 1 glutamine amidotransferase [Bacteroidales bacterium]|nr:type 1 glutamine amidotransferase [Bacteroidales bacterium]